MAIEDLYQRLRSTYLEINPGGSAADLLSLITIADFATIEERTLLRGTASWFDALVICPGLHKQQRAPDLSKGEYPACAAMTTGYVFRVENEATVFQLQRLGKPGYLTTLKVSSCAEERRDGWTTASVCYTLTVLLCITTWLLIANLRDWWGLMFLNMLMLARLTNTTVIWNRAALGWKGAAEPGVQGDLFILLSQDRWIRMQGLVDDLKEVTSGQWLREPTFTENSFLTLATLLVYAAPTTWQGAQPESRFMLFVLLIGSMALLAISNQCTTEFRMYGKVMAVDGQPKKYGRRLELAEELIDETGRNDWAIRLGMIQADKAKPDGNIDEGPKIM